MEENDAVVEFGGEEDDEYDFANFASDSSSLDRGGHEDGNADGNEVGNEVGDIESQQQQQDAIDATIGDHVDMSTGSLRSSVAPAMQVVSQPTNSTFPSDTIHWGDDDDDHHHLGNPGNLGNDSNLGEDNHSLPQREASITFETAMQLAGARHGRPTIYERTASYRGLTTPNVGLATHHGSSYLRQNSHQSTHESTHQNSNQNSNASLSSQNLQNLQSRNSIPRILPPRRAMAPRAQSHLRFAMAAIGNADCHSGNDSRDFREYREYHNSDKDPTPSLDRRASAPALSLSAHSAHNANNANNANSSNNANSADTANMAKFYSSTVDWDDESSNNEYDDHKEEDNNDDDDMGTLGTFVGGDGTSSHATNSYANSHTSNHSNTTSTTTTINHPSQTHRHSTNSHSSSAASLNLAASNPTLSCNNQTSSSFSNKLKLPSIHHCLAVLFVLAVMAVSAAFIGITINKNNNNSNNSHDISVESSTMQSLLSPSSSSSHSATTSNQELLMLAETIVQSCQMNNIQTAQGRHDCQQLCLDHLCCFEHDHHNNNNNEDDEEEEDNEYENNEDDKFSCIDDENKSCPTYAGCENLIREYV